MTVKDIIVMLCKEHELSNEQLATELGYASKSNIAVPLSREEGMNMKVSTLIRWLEALDAELSVYSVSSEEEFVLNGESEGVTYE